MKYGSKDDIRNKAERAIERHEQFCENIKGATNPDVIEMAHRAQGQILGLRAMLDAMNGNMVSLNVEASGSILF